MDELRDLHGDARGLLPVNPAESEVPSINAPDGVEWGSCLSLAYGNTRQLLLIDANRIQFQSFDGSSWRPWTPIATATPPQEFDLPLADGWVRVNAAEYWKTQEGLVIVTFRVARENGAGIDTSTQMIATLPESFRPPSNVTPHAAASTMVMGSNETRDAVVWVDSAGNIYTQASNPIPAKDGGTPLDWGGFAATLVFVAAS